MALTRKLRDYFKGLTTYIGVQLEGIDSIGFVNDPDDTATELTQGFVKKSTDVKAMARDNDDSDGFARCVLPSQLPDIILETDTDNVATVPVIEYGMLSVTPIIYTNSSGEKAKRWKIECKTGTPTSVVNDSNMDVLHIDTADNNGIYLKANEDEFEENSNTLNLKDGGITFDKLEPLSANKAIISSSTGKLETSSTSNEQINALSSIGNNKVIVTGATGNIEAHPAMTKTELEYLQGATEGVSVASKAVILDSSKKIDTLDITTPKFNGTEVTSTAAELNILTGTTATKDDINLLTGQSAAGVVAADISILKDKSTEGFTPDDMGGYMTKTPMYIHLSFETDYTGKQSIRVPFIGFLSNIYVCVEKAIAGTDDATINFKDNNSNNLGGSGLVSGDITLPASSVMGYTAIATPSSNHAFEYGDTLYVEPRKTTPGGTVHITLEFTKVNSVS